MSQPRQEINLLQDELRERKRVLPARQLALCAAAALAALALLSAWMTQRVRAPRAELAALEAQIRARSASVAELATQLDARRPDAELERDARRLELHLVHLRRATASARAPRAPQPLSAFMEGLGRRRPEGLWLTRIVLANGGRDIALGGSALQPSLLPAYLEALGEESAFAGQAFGDLVLERPADDARWVNFRIAAGCLSAPGGTAACPGIDGERP